MVLQSTVYSSLENGGGDVGGDGGGGLRLGDCEGGGVRRGPTVTAVAETVVSLGASGRLKSGEGRRAQGPAEPRCAEVRSRKRVTAKT